MAGTLVSLLPDFSNPVAGEASGNGLLRAVKVVPETNPVPQQPVVDRQAELIRLAEARVRAEEREAARKELEDAIAAEKVRYLEDLNDQRTIWVEQQALQLSVQISAAVDRLEANISERVANTIRPFVSEAFRQQSLAEFKDVLETLLSGRDAGLLKISGPEDLLSVMKSHLERYGSSIEFLPSELVEMSVIAQDTLVQTQLNSWSVRLAQALEG
jgi:predicted nucleic acid-binding protein